MPPRPPAARFSPGFAMGLAPLELEALKTDHIYTNSTIAAVRQSSGRLLLRGEESGGAGRAVGHYAGYAPLDGHPFQLVQPIRTVMPNAQHRRIFGTVMVRFEIFQYSENQVHTHISLHTIVPSADPKHRAADSHLRRVLFEARFGEITEDNTPSFISLAGEPLAIPSFLSEGFQQALKGSRCRACRHSHLDKVTPITLPPGLLSALRLVAPKSTYGEK